MNTITKEKIIETAENLLAAGKNPTQVSVREALGGGSFATIGPVLKDWKEGKKEESILAEITVPAAISERISQLQGAVWEVAIAEAEAQLKAEREALKTAQEAAQSEVYEQKEIVLMLENEAEQLKKTVENLENNTKNIVLENEKLEKELASISNNAAVKNAELTAKAEAAEQTAAQARKDLEELKAEHKKEIESLKQAAKAEAEQSKNDLKSLGAEYKKDLKNQQEEAAKAIMQQKKDQEELLKTKNETTELLINKLANAEKALENQQKTEEKLRAEILEQVKKSAQAEGQIIELGKQLATKAKPAAKKTTSKPAS